MSRERKLMATAWIAMIAVSASSAPPRCAAPKATKIVEFGFKSPMATEVASGGNLLVDVEFGSRHQLYALAQGVWAGAGKRVIPRCRIPPLF